MFDDWQRFERYLTVTQLDAAGSKKQCDRFLYYLGPQVEDVPRTFNFSDKEAKVYEMVKSMFVQYFDTKRNIIYDRAKFNMRMQG